MFDDIFDDALKGTEEGIIDIGKAGNDDWDTELTPDVWSTGKPPDIWKV
uniref:Uncharacterized protein n=1 Tax=viral metagenome TaxID=1070528 RepID=A0A6M3JQ52_9ZZZZ